MHRAQARKQPTLLLKKSKGMAAGLLQTMTQLKMVKQSSRPQLTTLAASTL